MRYSTLLLLAGMLMLTFSSQGADGIAEKTKDMQKYEGYFNFYWDEQAGKIWLEIDKLDSAFLYYTTLSAGAGSNDIGLDRGRLGTPRVMEFRRSGPKILWVEPNQRYRAVTADEAEAEAVRESFAESVLFGFTVAAEEEGRVLVDASDFFLSDAYGVSAMIKEAGQGTFKVDASRSAFYLPRTRNFPQNTEVEVTLTFTGEDAGHYLSSVSPNAKAVTLRQHHSFVQLPDNNYQPRHFNPRSGYISVDYMDYATAVDQPVIQRLILRHRLQKKNPGAAVSEAVEPIVYYMDPGAPQPIRDALMDGMRWWNQAFEAAGYKNAFQVKLLSADADPMDIRYNIVQWVHRSTRGWSYGGSIYDPRTGEIIKGKVTLGSLRVRQDFLIASGLVAAYEEGKAVSDAMLQMSLQRLRQLAAHEVGHTLGLVHNYAASYNNLASVMDYPHPVVGIENGKLDLSQAYTNEIGSWDKVAIAYGYQDFPEGVDEKQALDTLLQKAVDDGLLFISDRDARAAGGAHPYAHLWDNGNNAVEELRHVMEVRRIALSSLSEKKIPFGQPLATLEEVLVPMYMFHRYQTEAVAKILGGLKYSYAVRGDGQLPLEMVSGDEQRQALQALLETLQPEFLMIPEQVLSLLPPYPLGFDENPREVFPSRTGITFDPVAAAEASAHFTLSLMLHPERATRMIDFSARNSSVPGFAELSDALLGSTYDAVRRQGYAGELQRLVERLLLDQFIQMAVNPKVSGQARAMATLKIGEIRQRAAERVRNEQDASWRAHYAFVLTQIKNFENNPDDITITPPLPAPDGSPIGQEAAQWCGFVH